MTPQASPPPPAPDPEAPLLLHRIVDDRPRPSAAPTLRAWRPLEVADPDPSFLGSGHGRYHDLGMPEHIQGTLALSLDGYPEPAGARARGPSRAQEDLEPRPPEWAEDEAMSHLLPDPEVWGPTLMLHVAETAAGQRRVLNLARHVSPDVLARLGRRHALAVRRHAPAGPVRLRLVRVQTPRPGVAEIASVVEQSHLTRAVAARLIGLRGRWVMTVLDLG